MKAAVLEAIGSTPRFADFVEPSPSPGEILVHVTASAIKPLDLAIARGTHYSSPKSLPVVCGMDGVGRTDEGERVYFTAFRRPFGAMAQRAPASWVVPVPEGLDDAVAAAVVNPALAAWLPLQWRGRLAKGETVLVLGATGAAGRMALQAARLLGAARVVAAGRNAAVLDALDADATIDLRLPAAELEQAFAEMGRVDVVVDYLWGAPVEALLRALTRPDLNPAATGSGIRLVSVGEMAGATIALPAAALRGSRIEILGSGTANFPPVPDMRQIVGEILALTAAGKLTADIERAALSDVADVWERAAGAERRPVLMVPAA